MASATPKYLTMFRYVAFILVALFLSLETAQADEIDPPFCQAYGTSVRYVSVPTEFLSQRGAKFGMAVMSLHGPVIYYDRKLREFPKAFRQHVLHECAHHKKGHSARAYTGNEAHEYQADCAAIQEMRRRGYGWKDFEDISTSLKLNGLDDKIPKLLTCLAN